MNKEISMLEQDKKIVFQKKIKNALIALSVVNDMEIPQRLAEIKEFIKSKKWNDPEWLNKVYQEHKNLLNDKKIKLKPYLDYKKIKIDEEKII